MLRALALVAAVPACGRIDFDAGDAGTSDGAPDASQRPIAWVQVFAARHPGPGAIDTFTTPAAAQVGDTIVLEVACSDAMPPTAVSVTAPGWVFTQLDPINAATATQLYAASYTTIALATAPATVTVTWTGTTCQVGKAELGDEFANVGPIDAHALVPATGACSGTVTTGHANDAVWGACFDATSISGVGPGYTKGADNAGGDWSEYKLTADPAGTQEPISFTSPNVGYVLAAAALAPY